MERNSIVDRIDAVRKSRGMSIAASDTAITWQPDSTAGETVALVRSRCGHRQYRVRLSQDTGRCNCPDSCRGHCKHVCAVAIKKVGREYIRERCAKLGISFSEAAEKLKLQMDAVTSGYKTAMRYAVLLSVARELAREQAITDLEAAITPS